MIKVHSTLLNNTTLLMTDRPNEVLLNVALIPTSLYLAFQVYFNLLTLLGVSKLSFNLFVYKMNSNLQI